MFFCTVKLGRINFLLIAVCVVIYGCFGHLAFADQVSETKESTSSFSRPSLLALPPKKIENKLNIEEDKKKSELDKKSKDVLNKKRVKKSDDFTVKMLPLSYGDWVLDVKNIHSPGEKQCVAVNSHSIIDDGHSNSSVVVEVTSKAIRIYTESLIDVSYLDMGIAVDKFDRVDIDSVFSDTNVVFNFHVDQLIAQMREGDKAVLTLGFWPEWPMTHTYSTDISLSGFSKIMNKLNVCDKKIT